MIHQGDIFWLDLADQTGALPTRRVRQIIDGLRFAVEPTGPA